MLSHTSGSTIGEVLRRHANRRQPNAKINVDPQAVKAKVIEDINFLRSRIDHIRRAETLHSNPTIVKTYESMLESRESVLAWIDDFASSTHENATHNCTTGTS